MFGPARLFALIPGDHQDGDIRVRSDDAYASSMPPRSKEWGSGEGIRLNQFVLIENLSIQKIIRRRAASLQLLGVTDQAGSPRPFSSTSITRPVGQY